MKRTIPIICLVLTAGLEIQWISKPEVRAAEPTQLKLETIMRAELEGAESMEVIMSLIEFPPNTVLPKHYHPGEEFVYILEGSGIIWQKGKADIRLK